MDCNYQLISSNQLGNVMHCPDCNQFIIGLGTVILKFCPEQSDMFGKALVKASKDISEDYYEMDQKIFLKTPVNNLMIALNFKELTLAIELVEYALLRFEVESLIQV